MRTASFTSVLIAFLSSAAFTQITLVSSAFAGMAECTPAFNRATSLMNNGDAWLCNNQQAFLNALDTAAAACAGVNSGVNFGALKSQFMASARGCPSGSNPQGAGGESGRTAPGTGRSSADENTKAALNRARAEGDQAERYNKEILQCDQKPDSDQRLSCRIAATKTYQGSGSVSSGTGSTSASTGGPNDDPGEKPKAPPPKDPGVDYSGQSCAYFTRSAVEEEGGRLNYYTKGSCVSYGQLSYECGDDGRWFKRGPAIVFKCKTAEELESAGNDIRRWDIKKK